MFRFMFIVSLHCGGYLESIEMFWVGKGMAMAKWEGGNIHIFSQAKAPTLLFFC